MKNLGEKLKAAREAGGYSIKDAAEITRLRADFIEHMETGDFEFGLQEIYRRGFLRIYAKFLRLDENAVIAEYAENAVAEVGDENRHKHLLSRKPETVPPEIIEPHSRYEEDSSSVEESKSDENDNMRQYLKLGGIFIGVLLAVVVLVSLISFVVRPSVPSENPDVAIVGASVADKNSPANADISKKPDAVVSKEFTFKIVALADTYIVANYMDDKGQPIFAGALEAGKEKLIKSTRPFRIKITDAERVRLEKNGKVLNLGGAKGLYLGDVSAD